MQHLANLNRDVQVTHVDAPTVKLCDLLYSSVPMKSMSTTLLVDKLGITRRKMIPRELRIAATVQTAYQNEQRRFQMSLAEAASKGKLELILYVESNRMDETPMPV